MQIYPLSELESVKRCGFRMAGVTFFFILGNVYSQPVLPGVQCTCKYQCSQSLSYLSTGLNLFTTWEEVSVAKNAVLSM